VAAVVERLTMNLSLGGRQERQAEVEEVVEAVMPPRSILLGAEARQDYWGFLTRMSQLEDARQNAHDKLSGSRHRLVSFCC
jgi:hypothetical protein